MKITLSYRAKHLILITTHVLMLFLYYFRGFALNSVKKKRLEWRGIWLLALDTNNSDGGKSHSVIAANTSCRPLNGVSELLTAEWSVKTFTPVNGQLKGMRQMWTMNIWVNHWRTIKLFALHSKNSAKHLKLAFYFPKKFWVVLAPAKLNTMWVLCFLAGVLSMVAKVLVSGSLRCANGFLSMLLSGPKLQICGL